jgi:hypothetical protein
MPPGRGPRLRPVPVSRLHEGSPRRAVAVTSGGMDAVPTFHSLSSILGIFTALIAPALLISACGTLILSTSNRLTRVVDRVRQLSDRVERLGTAEEGLALRLERQQTFSDQLHLMSQRARLLQRALQLLYVASGTFVGSSLALGLEASTGALPNWLPVLLAIIGSLVMLSACASLVLEARRQAASMRHEMGFLLKLLEHSTAPRASGS